MTGRPHDGDGCRILQLDEVGSTNTYALGLAAAGEAGPLWVVARRQTQGRGRAGRSWASVDGNLYASLLVTSSCSPLVVHQLSLLAGVAVFEAVSAVAADAGVALPGLRLKWPNDVLIQSAKLAGILPESSTLASGRLAVVIGVGLNLAGSPVGIGRAATSLAAAGLNVAPDAMVGRLNAAIMGRLAAWADGHGFPAILAAWSERAGSIGEAMAINTGSGPIEGTFGGVDADGALLLREASGAVRRFTYGDVTLASRERTSPGVLTDSETGSGGT